MARLSKEDWMRNRVANEIARGFTKPTYKTDAFLKGATVDQLRAMPKPKTPSVFKQLDKFLNDEISKILEPPKEQRKTKSHRGNLYADTSGSDCFDALFYSAADGGVIGSFIGPSAGEYFFPVSRSEAKAWFSDSSLGGYYNDVIRGSRGKSKGS